MLSVARQCEAAPYPDLELSGICSVCLIMKSVYPSPALAITALVSKTADLSAAVALVGASAAACVSTLPPPSGNSGTTEFFGCHGFVIQLN